MDITVASWNIWIFGDRDTEAIADVIREHDIDIIGIQEAAIYFDEEKPRNTAKEIAEELDYHYTYHSAIDFRPERPSKQGNAVISRYPIEDNESYNLNPEDVSYDGTYETEPRILVEAEIDVEGKTLHLLTTHLQYSHRFETTDIRTGQVHNILSVVEDIDHPVILTGDFNAPVENNEIKMIEEQTDLTKVGGKQPTWTVQPFEHEGWEVNELRYRLDNIYTSPELECINTEIIQSELSDHLPIKAEISLD